VRGLKEAGGKCVLKNVEKSGKKWKNVEKCGDNLKCGIPPGKMWRIFPPFSKDILLVVN